MSLPTPNRRILVIDDNTCIHDDFRKVLAARGAAEARDRDILSTLEADLFGDPVAPASAPLPTYEVDAASQGEEGYELVRRAVADGKPYALAFVDMRMPPGWDGVKTIEMIWKVDEEIQVVLCTAYSDYSWEDIVHRFGMHDRLLILKKPFDTSEVCQLACALTEKWQLARQAHLKVTELRTMVDEQTRGLAEANERLQEEVAQRQASEERYRLAAVGSNDGLWDWDLVSGTVYYSPRFHQLLGYGEAELGGTLDAWLRLVDVADLPAFRAALESWISNGTDHLSHELRMLRRDGEVLWLLVRGVGVRDPSGRKVRAAGSISDVTARRRAEEQLRFDAFHDTLTGLANRALLEARLDNILGRTEAYDRACALLFMDMDKFKVINDTLGHLVGDQLLAGVAGRLRGAVRGSDLVVQGNQSEIARIGGDEFVVLLEGVREEATALRVAERIHAALAEPFPIDGHEIHARVSVGITVCQPEQRSGHEVLRDADAAMYEAKSSGRAQTRVFDQGMLDAAADRARTEGDLRVALDRDELLLHFQPIFHAVGDVACVEALLRWRHPTRGLLSAREFLPLAESAGLMSRIGRWVIQEACAQLGRWSAELTRAGREPGGEPLRVAVNVSPRQWGDPGFVPFVEQVVREAGLPEGSLVLELTESLVLARPEESRRMMDRLHGVGVRFQIDDFGTGATCLGQLVHLPVTALKVDQGFVAGMAERPEHHTIVRAIIGLAHAVRMSVVAEGVQTDEAARELRRLGCDAFQGYLFCSPMPASDVTSLLLRDAVIRASAA